MGSDVIVLTAAALSLENHHSSSLRANTVRGRRLFSRRRQGAVPDWEDGLSVWITKQGYGYGYITSRATVYDALSV